MLVGIEKVNTKNEEIRKLVVLSMDVEKMYPRMKADRVAAVVAAEYRASTLVVEVDPVALGLYLAIMMEREELVARGLGEVVQTRKRGGGRGRKIGITTAEVTQETVPEEKKLFYPPQRAPTVAEEREMFGNRHQGCHGESLVLLQWFCSTSVGWTNRKPAEWCTCQGVHAVLVQNLPSPPQGSHLKPCLLHPLHDALLCR